jgi:hypothetical protein
MPDDEEADQEKPRQDTIQGDPRATEHPTGDKQAAENVENEPAG